MPPQMRFALIDMQRSLADLSEKVELRVLNDNTGDAVRTSRGRGQADPPDARRAEGRARMGRRAGQQQHELATVLRQITDKAKLPAREERN